MYILFDIGGTKTRIAKTVDCVSFEEPVIFETPEKFEDAIRVISEKILELADGEELAGACGDIAGIFNPEKDTLLHSPHLLDWSGKSLKAELESRIKAPVHLENDADLVGLGEAVHGAGQGFSIVAYLTISTGVGGGRIVDGKIDKRVFSFEPGFQIIDIDKTATDSVNPEGHLEGFVSGSYMEKRFNKKPFEVEQSDPVWNELAKELAVGLHNVICFWSPDVIILGGSMMVGDPAISTDTVYDALKEIPTVFPRLPELKKAELGSIGGLYGALALANSKHICV